MYRGVPVMTNEEKWGEIFKIKTEQFVMVWLSNCGCNL